MIKLLLIKRIKLNEFKNAKKKSYFLILLAISIIFSTNLAMSSNDNEILDNNVNSFINNSAIEINNSIIIISDNSTIWNKGISAYPSIAVDSSGTIHVVWYDDTDGTWGSDIEIMYASNSGSGWSNPIVISDDETLWNDGSSINPSIAIDTFGNVHVIWEDETDGAWGSDSEIMYASNSGSGWTHTIVISDNEPLWNNGGSSNPSIVIDPFNNIHVVWQDYTFGAWGNDIKIMYTSFVAFKLENGSIPFGYTFLFFMLIGIIGVLFFIKKKSLKI